MATTTYVFTVTIDTRWPPSNGDNVYQGISEDGRRFLGWWSLDQFQDWARQRCAAITQNGEDIYHVAAPLTATEIKRLKGIIR